MATTMRLLTDIKKFRAGEEIHISDDLVVSYLLTADQRQPRREASSLTTRQWLNL
jgi:hypothetical protein